MVDNAVWGASRVFLLFFAQFCPFSAAKIRNPFYFCTKFNVQKKEKMPKSKFLTEFKQFAVKGNAIDMAVGVIIGGAFGKIVTSVVNDLIMPPIGWLIGGVDFKDLKVELPLNPMAAEGTEAVTINYGNFIQTTFDFIIIAFCVFLLVRAIMKLSKKKEEAPAAPAPPAPSAEETLLTEIRDLLKEKK